jgi:microcystin degradation protein MlrC
MDKTASSRPLRVAIAGFKLESVTFLPNLTTLADYQAVECAGPAMLQAHRGANTPVGGFIAVCEREGVEMLPIVYTEAGAAGPCADEAYDHYLKRILDGLQGQEIDGVLLDLHGAMTTPTRLDADADTLAAVRRVVGPDVPVMVALDYHANLDENSIRDADAVFGYHFSPHTDQAETGERAAHCLVRTLRGEIKPVMALRKPGLMVPSIFSATSIEPLAGFVQKTISMGTHGDPYLDVTLFAGFPYSDVPNCGFSVLAVTDGDPQGAAAVASRLSDAIHRARPAFSHRELVYGVEDGLDEAVRIAAGSDRPVVLLEHADRLCDSTYVLRAVLQRKLGRTAVPLVWDPQAVEKAMSAGVGQHVRLPVGGFSSLKAGGPVDVEGKILFAGPKSYRATGPYYTGRLVNLGDVVVIDTGFAVISISSRPYVAVSDDCFTEFGMAASDFDYILLRSKTHFRAVYEPLAAAIVIIDTPDWGPADLSTLDYAHVPRERTYPFSEKA